MDSLQLTWKLVTDPHSWKESSLSVTSLDHMTSVSLHLIVQWCHYLFTTCTALQSRSIGQNVWAIWMNYICVADDGGQVRPDQREIIFAFYSDHLWRSHKINVYSKLWLVIAHRGLSEAGLNQQSKPLKSLSLSKTSKENPWSRTCFRLGIVVHSYH